eukprot:GILI01006640.1.p1 GENE.GILI01006640.1~~GILI01006640.1.p1  ORF type:complete len:1099 (+),score=393.71 GILI01006640.1:64-3360(+)
MKKGGNKFGGKTSSTKGGSSQFYDGNPINAKAKDTDWDEDIDDDMAFNSDDEKLYGHYFNKSSSAASGSDKKGKKVAADKKVKGKSKKQLGDEEDNADSGEMTGIFDRLNPLTATTNNNKANDNKNNDDEIGSEVFSDDSRSEIDLEEMLMTKDEQRRQREKRQKKNKRDNEGVTKTSKTLGGRAGATETDDFLLRQQEGVLISSDIQEKLQSLSTARAALSSKAKKSNKVNIDPKTGKEKKEADDLYDISNAVINPEAEKRILGKNEMSSIKALVDESEGVDKGKTSTRLLAAVNNRKSLLTEDIDEYEKTKQDRSQTREIVAKGLKKYDGVLKEQQMAKHLQFPLNVSDADAVPHSLGGMAAALINKNEKAAAASAAAAQADGSAAVPQNSLAAKMQALLESSGLATKKKAPSDGSGAFKEGQEGFVDIRDRPEGAEDNEGDENEFAMNRGGTSENPDRNYMAMLKAKLGYEIARRTRFNKIKSKTYRRILRKEEERETQRREQAAEILDPEGARRKRMEKMEKDRALERVTQKHKNTSKWVRHVKGIAKFDDNAKDAIQQQLLQHQRLMTKMDEDAGAEWETYDEAEKASQAESEEQDRIVDELVNAEGEKPKSSSLFWNKDKKDEEKKDPKDMTFIDKARKELNSMGFMQKAKQREEKEYQDQVEKLQSDVARYKRGEALEHVDEDGNEKSESSKKASQASNSSGRKRFTAANAVIHTEQTAEDEAMEKLLSKVNHENDDFTERRDDEDDEPNKSKQQTAAEATDKKLKKLKVKAAPLTSGGIAANNNFAAAAEELDAADREKAALADAEADRSDFVGLRKLKGLGDAASKEKKTTKRGRAATADEDAFHGRDGATAEEATPAATQTTNKSSSTRITLHPTSFNDIIPVAAISSSSTPGNSTSASQSASGESDAEGAHQLQQEYLASRAFAKDDIDEDFLKMKEQQVEAIMKPKDKNATLPGWGEWGGEHQRLNTRHKAKVEQMELQRSLQKSALMKARADAHLDHVIISHEVDLVPGKYALHMIPRPFSNAKEYALSMRQPVGPEWNTPMSFKETTQPRITTIQGAVIEPMDLSLRKEKAKTKRRKVEKKKQL